jgi:hypothetical protein
MLMVVLKDSKFLGMGFQILLRQIDFGFFLIVVATRIVLAIFSSVATSSTMVIRVVGSLVTLTKLFGCFSLAC